MNSSRLPGLHKLNVTERITRLQQQGWLTAQAAGELLAGRQVICAAAADKIIENVIGVFALPLAIAPNFLVNGRECIVPLVVEEPSVVAGLSSAAASARLKGGFSASLSESLLAGQIHVVGLEDIESALALLGDAEDELLRAADAVHPRLTARGGGVRSIEFKSLQLSDGSPLLVVHVLVDTCDAMGANLVNTICESIAPRIVTVCGGDVALRILSNLADRSVCQASCRYAMEALTSDSMCGEEIRDRIVLASEIAEVDPYRAATHNKGIMNGIDALAIATGNDWRAIEAGAHAFAARNSQYSTLARWSVANNGELEGEIALPLKVATVGGTVSSNPAASLGLALAGVESATQLAELMAAVGLAQNFAALRALAGKGIQHGHMKLHARSIATAAGTPHHQLAEVVDEMVASGDIKAWKASEILSDLDDSMAIESAAVATAAGKIILFGEHAVVYGRHALAVPIVEAVRATARSSSQRCTLNISEWGLHRVIDSSGSEHIDAVINRILAELGVAGESFQIDVASRLPRGMGLGSSAAIAVAITRAIAQCMGIDMSDERVNEIAFSCETLVHGTPSGIDNTLSCYAQTTVFRNAGALDIQTLQLSESPPLVVALGHQAGSTHEQVAGVRKRFNENRRRYDALFDQMDEFSRAGANALAATQYDEVGRLMNVCHGLLNAIEVSTPDLENMVSIARRNGAVGAKLTGAGGGGSIVALCPGREDEVRSALHLAGYESLTLGKPAGQSS